MPFLAIFDVLPILSEIWVQKNFGVIFSNEMSQSGPKMTYFVVITHFGKLCSKIQLNFGQPYSSLTAKEPAKFYCKLTIPKPE